MSAAGAPAPGVPGVPGHGAPAVRRNPVPSLLTSLLSNHLDPGYAAAVRRPGRRRQSRAWSTVGALVVGLVLGVAAVEASEGALDTEQVRSGLVADVEAARLADAALAARRAELTSRTDAVRTDALAGDASGRTALRELERLEALAGATAVSGPGLQVVVTDSVAETADDGTAGPQRGTVLDRDLQRVVNDLWASGAEAVTVGGVRMTPTSTVRQAGGAMLVDNQPVPSPYTVAAVGDPRAMQTRFVTTDAYLRLSAVAQVYGIGFTVQEADSLQLPAASPSDPELAVAEGAP